MKWTASNIEVIEWDDLSPLIKAMEKMEVLEQFPGQLSFSIQFDPTDGVQLPFSITWTYVVFYNSVQIWKYVGLVQATIEKEVSPPTMKELNDLIHNILFFRYTCHFYWEWQSENPLIDPYAIKIDILKNKDIFDLADQIRVKLM